MFVSIRVNSFLAPLGP